MFRHPLGGVAKIDIGIRDGNLASVSGAWWKDDFDAGTRSLKSFEQGIVMRDNAVVEHSASKLLTKILAHPYGAWSDVVDGFKTMWQPYRHIFEDNEKRYPFPKEKTVLDDSP